VNRLQKFLLGPHAEVATALAAWEGREIVARSELAIGWLRDIATLAALVRREESSGGLVITVSLQKSTKIKTNISLDFVFIIRTQTH
jgi:hypothetical protein